MKDKMWFQATTGRHSGVVDGLRKDLGIYLHIPFCMKRCHFCAFYLILHHEQRIQQFIRALDREILLYAMQPEMSRRTVSTVYIGGGTPTALLPLQLSNILSTLTSRFSLAESCEITVEATPESLTAAYAQTLQLAGVTRLSVGIQSFDPLERTRLGLSGNVMEAIAGIHIAKLAGFSNINIDLIYGIPGQTVQSWERTLVRAMELDPAHLSCYALSLEEGTRFHREFRRGRFDIMDPDSEMKFLYIAEAQMASGGFDQYEISNWTKPGNGCQHNLRYWRGLEYLGLGPSAQSYVSETRFGNVANIEKYSSRLEAGELPIADKEVLSRIQQTRERMVFGLRLLEGVPMDWVEDLSEDQSWLTVFNKLVEDGWFIQANSRWQLTRKGRRFADTIGMQLLYV